MSTTKRPFLEDLERRGLVHDTTADVTEPDFRERPTLYVGYDPTATSLHVGSLIPLLTMDRFRRRGGRIIVLLGGATGLVGDPSGKSAERVLQTRGVVRERVEALRKQVTAFFQRTDGPEPLFVNNADWYGRMNIIDLLRDIGKHFSVNQMLTRDSVRTRIERNGQGISFTEFSYQLLQAYDFLHLFRTYGCRWQMGASDQWGNIISGVDLVRRCTGETVLGLTLPLLTNSQGRKYGKSEQGTMWLDPELTSPYAFYQFWLNTTDADAPRFLSWLTDLEPDEISEILSHPPHKRVPQRELAYTLTARVHGEEQALLARQASEVAFSGRFELLTDDVVEMLASTMPTHRVARGQSCTLLDALLALEAVSSRGEVRRLVKQRALRINNDRVTDCNMDLDTLHQGRPALLVAIGKNRRYLVRFAES